MPLVIRERGNLFRNGRTDEYSSRNGHELKQPIDENQQFICNTAAQLYPVFEADEELCLCSERPLQSPGHSAVTLKRQETEC